MTRTHSQILAPTSLYRESITAFISRRIGSHETTEVVSLAPTTQVHTTACFKTFRIASLNVSKSERDA